MHLLIADDVGSGKTIEGVLVITPASLREQWQDTLKCFFHIEAQLFSRQPLLPLFQRASRLSP